jgi:hypothetical protein
VSNNFPSLPGEPSFLEIACRSCAKGGEWKLYTDGKGNFRAKHSCGHVSKFELKDKPDPKVYSLRSFI